MKRIRNIAIYKAGFVYLPVICYFQDVVSTIDQHCYHHEEYQPRILEIRNIYQMSQISAMEPNLSGFVNVDFFYLHQKTKKIVYTYYINRSLLKDVA